MNRQLRSLRVILCIGLAAYGLGCSRGNRQASKDSSAKLDKAAAKALQRMQVPPDRHRRSGRRSDAFPNIVLYTQDNQPVRFYDDLVKDRTVIINFMYTRCTGIWPGTIANLVKVHKYLGDRVGRDILMLSISIDAKHDTPEVMKEYAEGFGVKKGWLFLTGDYDEIEELRYSLGVYDLDPIIDADITQHAGIVTFGNDRTDRWAALPALMDAKQIANSIQRIVRVPISRTRGRQLRETAPQSRIATKT